MKILILADDDNACQGLLTNLAKSLVSYGNHLSIGIVCEPSDNSGTQLESMGGQEKRISAYTLNQTYSGETDLSEVRLWAENLIGELRPDVVHVISPLYVIDDAQCPLIYTIHSGTPVLWDYIGENQYDLSFINYQQALSRMLNGASAVTATSNALATYARGLMPELDDIKVIYPCVEERYETEHPSDRILISVADYRQEAIATELMAELFRAGRKADLYSPLHRTAAGAQCTWESLLMKYDIFISLDGDEMRVLQACMASKAVFAAPTPALMEMWPIHLHYLHNAESADAIACKVLGANDEEISRQRLLARVHAGRYTLQRMGTGYMQQYKSVMQTAKLQPLHHEAVMAESLEEKKEAVAAA